MLKGLFGKGEDVVDQYRAAGEQTGVFTLSLMNEHMRSMQETLQMMGSYNFV